MLSYPLIYLQCGCIWQRLIRSTSSMQSVVPILQSDIGTCRLDVFEEVRLPSTSFLEAVLERTDGSRINNFLRCAIPSVYNPSLLAGDSKAVPNRPYFRSGPEHQCVRPGALFVPVSAVEQGGRGIGQSAGHAACRGTQRRRRRTGRSDYRRCPTISDVVVPRVAFRRTSRQRGRAVKTWTQKVV